MATNDAWRIWDREMDYGELLFKRAIGELPEMESSKAVARLIKNWVKPDDRLLDIGCGSGHYLRSLRQELDIPFSYTGIDAAANYISLAEKAWSGEKNIRFQVGDVFSLPFHDGEYDIAFSCNLFLHLPSIRVALSEIVRVARRHILIRTLVGDRSFRIKEVYSAETHPKSVAGSPGADEFDEKGEPYSFHYYNIYSKSYIIKMLSRLPGGGYRYRIIEDRQYDPAQLAAEAKHGDAAPDVTQMIGQWQVNGYILQPWHFILIDKLP